MFFENKATVDKMTSPEIEERKLSDDGEITDDRTVTSLTLDDADKSGASLPLTGGHGVVVRSYTKSPHYLPLAVITLLVNAVFGVPAVLCACLSRSRRLRGEEEGAARLGKAAFWLSMVGIAISVVVGVFVVVYFYVIVPNIISIRLGGGIT